MCRLNTIGANAPVVGRHTWLESWPPTSEVTLKSNVSDYLKVIAAVYIDAAMKCSADVSDLRDLKTITSRVKDEGLSFLTITLPKFCQDFERSLANEVIDSTSFSGFKRNKYGSIPAFLQGMISQIFDQETGRMKDEFQKSPRLAKSSGAANDFPTIIESVRQICLTFKKVELPCSPERVSEAFDSFISIEQSFESFSASSTEYDEFRRISDMLWGNMVVDISITDCHPKHGPGATAERVSGNQKYRWQYWHDRLEPYFPLIDNGYPLGTPLDSEELRNVTMVAADQEQPVRVTPVPKTLKGPRVIAIEPCCMQYTQQGIRDALYESLESYLMSAGHVNFSDQSINQKLALISSLTGQLATIDLSDASDRVPRSLALEMFRCNPDLRDAIDACRSTSAQLPDGRLVSPLQKFASMGSALCFPVEAMYFYTICVVALLKIQNLPETFRSIFNVTRDVYVYGDDIIVPSAYADTVLEHLRKYNCKVNTNKTFVSGSFRESCGMDALNGYEVTPTYIRQEFPENRQQASNLISTTASANQFYRKGYWRTADLLFKKVERILGPLPYVSETSEALGRISFLGYESAERWNRGLQRFEINGWVPRPVYRTDRLDGYGALQKCFNQRSERKDRVNSPSNALDVGVALSLERSALHGAVTLKRRWVSPH